MESPGHRRDLEPLLLPALSANRVLGEAFREVLTGPIRFKPFIERGYRAIRFEGRVGLEAIFGGNLVTNLTSPAGFVTDGQDVNVLKLGGLLTTAA
jgi:hypothetical protein